MPITRRIFLKHSGAFAAGASLLPVACAQAQQHVTGDNNFYVVGPIEGYSPHIGTLVTMLNYNRATVLDAVQSLSTSQLDFLFDNHANSIGALLLHLAAIEKIYQVTTFDNRKGFNMKEQKEWQAAMDLGDAARKTIRSHNLEYYIDRITEVRDETLRNFRQRDDKWLLSVDKNNSQPINNYWKWFHVCEHESNHRGQITWLKQRLPKSQNQN